MITPLCLYKEVEMIYDWTMPAPTFDSKSINSKYFKLQRLLQLLENGYYSIRMNALKLFLNCAKGLICDTAL